MRLTRGVAPGRAGRGLGLALAAAVAGGCDRPPAPPTAVKAPAEPDAVARRPGPPPPGPAGQPPAADLVAFAGEFLAAARAGTATPAMLTPAFKAVVGEPATDADRAQGFSDWAADQWLRGLAGRAATGPIAATPVTPDLVVATASPRPPAGPTVLRLARSPGGWLVDWVHVAPPVNPGDVRWAGQTLADRFAGVAFVDTVLTGDNRLTEAVLSPGAKARAAPPLGAGDARGYNRGLLGLRLAAFRGAATGYTLAAPGRPEALAGELTGPGGGNRPFALKLVKGPRPGEWLVDEFEAK